MSQFLHQRTQLLPALSQGLLVAVGQPAQAQMSPKGLKPTKLFEKARQRLAHLLMGLSSHMSSRVMATLLPTPLNT
jgi:hypothetical protein